MVGQFESNKDTVQELTESAASHIGNIATIITGAVRDIARETGDWLTDMIEMREASEKAKADESGYEFVEPRFAAPADVQPPKQD